MIPEASPTGRRRPAHEARDRVTVHESGHAVLALTLGIPVRQVWASADAGLTTYGVVGADVPSLPALLMDVAGEAAEQLAFGNVAASSPVDRASAESNAWILARDLDAVGGIIRRARRVARELLGQRRRWLMVNELSIAILHAQGCRMTTEDLRSALPPLVVVDVEPYRARIQEVTWARR